MSVAEFRDKVRDAPLKMIAARVRKARKEANDGKGMTLDALAEAAGTSRQHLISLEHGRHRPRPEMLTRIGEATGKPLEFFVDAEAVDNPFPDGEA